MKQIFELKARPSDQIKELRLLFEEKNNIGVYKVFTQWKKDPNFDGYIRILYSDDNTIDGLDFDGGPLIYPGYLLDENNKIIDIYTDKNTKEFLIKVKED